MDKDEYQKFLDEHIQFKQHRKYEAADSESKLTVIPCENKCPDCDRTVDRAPIRLHKNYGGMWFTYCKDCKNYLDPETGKFETRDPNRTRNYQRIYRVSKKLNNIVDKEPTNDSNQSDDS